MVALGSTLLFRYADFVTQLGGTEFHLGWIVGVGMIGSLVMRLLLGSCIDKYGSRIVWLASIVLFIVVCFGHLTITSHTGIAIYALRILFCCAVAGVGGASITFISKQGSDHQIAELVGMLGASGFLGIILGSCVGDLLMSSLTVGRSQVDQMFELAGLMGIISLPFAWLASRGEVRPKHVPGPSVFGVLRRHNPGAILGLGVALGLGLGLPGIFLRTYAADLGISRLGAFFTVYSVTGIVARVLTRHWPERYGTRPIILAGTSMMVGSMLLFLVIRAEWQLVVPAIGYGCFHAILFPAVIAAGSVSFPARHRGLATVLVLASSDFGQLIGAPATGIVLSFSRTHGLPPYPTMFLTMAGLVAAVGIWYAITTRKATLKKTP